MATSLETVATALQPVVVFPFSADVSRQTPNVTAGDETFTLLLLFNEGCSAGCSGL